MKNSNGASKSNGASNGQSTGNGALKEPLLSDMDAALLRLTVALTELQRVDLTTMAARTNAD